MLILLPDAEVATKGKSDLVCLGWVRSDEFRADKISKIYIYMCVCHNIYSNFFEYHNFTVSTSPTFIDGTGYVVAMKASVANDVAQAPHVQA